MLMQALVGIGRIRLRYSNGQRRDPNSSVKSVTLFYRGLFCLVITTRDELSARVTTYKTSLLYSFDCCVLTMVEEPIRSYYLLTVTPNF